MKPIFEYIDRQQEDFQQILLFVREIILATNDQIEESVKYKVPFYKYQGKMLMYMSVKEKEKYIDIAFVQGVLLQPHFPILENHKTRKQVRSFKIKHLEEFNVPMFEEMLSMACVFLETRRNSWLGK